MRKCYFAIITVFCLTYARDSLQNIFPDDTDCEQIGSRILNHIINKQPLPAEYEDAYKLLKYSGSGLNDMGDYYACQSLSYANYYKITILFFAGGQPSPQEIGFCYLKQCDTKYIQNAVYNLYDTLSQQIALPFEKSNIFVSSPQESNLKLKKDYFIGVLVILFFLAVMTILMFIGTTILKDNKIFSPFNILKNFNTIITVRNPNQTYNHLRVFDGVRFLSSGWVVFGHCFYLPMGFGTRNLLDITFLSKSWYSPFLLSAYYSVDVFFFMSGFLFYFSVQKLFKESFPKTKLIFMSILGRYCRLLPFLIFGVFGATYLLPYLSSGPNFSKIEAINYSCSNFWWHNFLYINNLMYYDNSNSTKQMCMGHSWYLACDMQFFIYSLLIVVVFNNYKIVQHIIYAFTFIFSIEWQYVQVYKYKYSYNDMVHPSTALSNNFFGDFYIQPFARIGPYLIGVYFCELFLNTKLYLKDYGNQNEINSLSKQEESNTNINSITNNNINDSTPSDRSQEPHHVPLLFHINDYIEKNAYASWGLFTFGLVCINASFWTSSIGNHYLLSLFWSATLNTWSKLVFILGLGIIIHLTYLDQFNFIRNFLTLKIMSTVSKSTYGIYVIHVFLAALYILAYETYYYLRIYDLFLLSMGIFIFAWVLALIIGLIIESPIIVICKILIKGEGDFVKQKPNTGMKPEEQIKK